MKKFKLAINDNPGVSVTDFAERVQLIAKVGFDGVFTGWSPDCPVGQWAEDIAKAGLIYQSIHAPFGRMEGIGKVSGLWEDPGEAGDAYTDMLIRCVAETKQVDVPLVIIHPYIGFDGHTPTELGLTRYGRLIEAADHYGVKLGFENVEGMEYLEAIMERYGKLDNVGFCWDTGHEMCYNYSQDMMAKYGDKLFGTHFNDNLGITNPPTITWHDDAHLLPFDGKADWQGIMDRINRHGYEGILTFELTTKNKPEKHTHDAYAAWTAEEYFAEAYARAARVAALGE